MRKYIPLWQLLYYILVLLTYIVFGALASWMLSLSGASENLGAVIAATYGLMFVATPVLTAVLMRFSLLRWYADPFAAAEIPLFLYCGMIVNRANRGESLVSAFLRVNDQLCGNAGEGWLFLLGLFAFALLASFSVARKEGKSISYRLLSGFLPG